MTVLITRPLKQARRLGSLFNKENIASILFPAIEIKSLSSDIDLSCITRAEFLIFVSPATVNCFFKHYSDYVVKQPLFAMGAGTASALRHFTSNAINTAHPANSCGMLALNQLQEIENKKIAILAGIDGNQLLAETLSARGGDIQMVYTHKRKLPNYTIPLNWSVNDISQILVTSGQSLQNLQKLMTTLGLEALYTKPLIVITPAMKSQAEQLGFSNTIHIAAGADDASLLQAVQTLK
jgi:uroporphyrinogen-III synthase